MLKSANRDITVQTVPWPVHQIVRLVGIWMVFAPVKRVGGIIIVQQVIHLSRYFIIFDDIEFQLQEIVSERLSKEIIFQNVSSPMEKIVNILAVNTALTISVTGSTENVCVMLNMVNQ